MRLDLTTFVLAAGLVLGTVACGAADEAAAPGDPNEMVTVTDMQQRPDGTWSTTTRSVPASQARPTIGDDVEQNSHPLASVACSGSSTIVLYELPGYNGSVLCLTPTGTGDIKNFVKTYQSGYTMSPIYLYNAAGQVVFFSCNTNFKYTSNFGGLASKAQEASQRFGICHF
jgi:hypothetical protein